jgi:hypothetical protein
LILTGPVGGVINPGTGISKLLDQKKWLNPSKVVMDFVVAGSSYTTTRVHPAAKPVDHLN